MQFFVLKLNMVLIMNVSNLQLSEDGLVNIRIIPDEQGRFGFNVKGGADLNMPILVSRVAPNTPADRCCPKLSEGDQVCSNFFKTVNIYHT